MDDHDWAARAETLERAAASELEELSVALCADATAALAGGGLTAAEESAAEKARLAAMSWLGRVDSKRSMHMLVNLLPEEDWKSPIYNLAARGLLAQTSPELPKVLAATRARAGIRILARRPHPEIAASLHAVAAEAAADGRKPNLAVLIYALIALGSLGEVDSQQQIAELLCDGRIREYDYIAAITDGAPADATYAMLAPVARSLRDGDRKSQQTRKSLLDQVNAQAKRHKIADARWLTDLEPEIEAEGDRWVDIIGGAIAPPRFEALRTLALDRWPYWAILPLAEEGDPRALEPLLAMLAQKPGPYRAAELLRAAHNIPEAPRPRLEAIAVDLLCDLAAERHGDLEPCEYIVDVLVSTGTPVDGNALERAALALERSAFAYDNARLGEQWLADVVAKLRRHAAS